MLTVIILVAVASVVLADVIYVYTGQITASPTTAPLKFSQGPNGNNNYVNFQANYHGFTATIYITNSSAAYFYEVGKLIVRTAGYIYVVSVSQQPSEEGGSAMINTMIIYIVPSGQSQGGQSQSQANPQCSLTIISGGEPISTPSSQTCSLSPGEYYINIYVVPNTPVTQGGQSETVTVYFGYNVVKQESVPVPPLPPSPRASRGGALTHSW